MNAKSTKCDEVYFSAGHALSQFHIDFKTFEAELYYGLLLHPSITIPDNALLCGRHVGRSLLPQQRGASWLEQGLTTDRVHVLLQPGCETLGQSLAKLKSRTVKNISRTGVGIADRCDAIRYDKRHWPDKSEYNLGCEYKRGLEEFFSLSPTVPLVPTRASRHLVEFSAFWERRREWRLEWIGAASRLTEAAGETGVRLTDIVDLVAFIVARDRFKKIDDIGMLLRIAKSKESEDRYFHRDLEMFFRICCEAYNLNWSDALSCSGTSPNWHRALGQMFWPGLDSETRGEEPEVYFDDMPLKLPTVEFLKSLSADEFVRVRDSDASHEYDEALVAWHISPNRTTRDALADSLKKYCETILDNVRPGENNVAFSPSFGWRKEGITNFATLIPKAFYVALGGTDVLTLLALEICGVPVAVLSALEFRRELKRRAMNTLVVRGEPGRLLAFETK